MQSLKGSGMSPLKCGDANALVSAAETYNHLTSILAELATHMGHKRLQPKGT
jgi:hypothetical protein